MRSEAKRLKDKANKLFSLFIRRKYSDEQGVAECYTCGRRDQYRNLQCGHSIGGRGNYVLFNADLCRVQCFQCNCGKGGNYEVFVPKLIREKGLGWYEREVQRSKKPLKRSKAELEQIILELNAQLDEFDDMGKP